MRIVLTKISDRQHRLEIVREDYSREGVDLVSRSFLVHDLLHYAVEAEAGLQGGVWGTLARGATLEQLGSFSFWMNMGAGDRTGKSMTAPQEMAMAEKLTGVLTGLAKGQERPADVLPILRIAFEAGGEPLPPRFDVSFIAAVEERMRRLLGRWKAVPYRQSMDLPWPPG